MRVQVGPGSVRPCGNHKFPSPREYQKHIFLRPLSLNLPVFVRSPCRAKHHVVVQYMAAGPKCPLPPLPLPQPPPPPPTPSPYQTPLPLPDPLPPWRKQGGQGRIDDITGQQGTSHCSCLEHCFLFLKRQCYYMGNLAMQKSSTVVRVSGACQCVRPVVLKSTCTQLGFPRACAERGLSLSVLTLFMLDPDSWECQARLLVIECVCVYVCVCVCGAQGSLLGTRFYIFLCHASLRVAFEIHPSVRLPLCVCVCVCLCVCVCVCLSVCLSVCGAQGAVL